MIAGSFLPFVDRTKFAPIHAWPYIHPYLTSILPNLIFGGGLFFCLALLKRKLLPVFMVCIFILIGYLLGARLSAVTLYDNKATTATYREMPNGKFDVKLTVAAKKLRADEVGKETEIPMNDWLDIGVLDKDGEAIVLQRVKMDKARREFAFTVDRQPAKAGIDPYSKLIDRKSDDNTVGVEKIAALEK